MTVLTRGRRHFLRGLAGTALAIPFLRSLSNEASAQTDPPPRRFVSIISAHGAIWHENIMPADSTLTESQTFLDHAIRRGALVPSGAGGRVTLSPTLSASDAILTPSLVAKMNALSGFNVPFNLAHHLGGHLGNYIEGNGSGPVPPRATIDQVMAASSAFYPDLGAVRMPAMTLGYRGMSFAPADLSVAVPAIPSSGQLLDAVYAPPEPTTGPTRPSVLNRVAESYRAVTAGAFGDARRLSATDRRRLEAHMDLVSGAERRLNARGRGCPPIDSVPDLSVNGRGDFPDGCRDYHGAMNDVIAIAFACDTSRIATLTAYESSWFIPGWTGDWHEDVAHRIAAVDGDERTRLENLNVEAHRATFEWAVADLASKLDAYDDGDGSTILDNSLIAWTHESGPSTHHGLCLPVITFGGAGGRITTGQYVDYRNMDQVVGSLRHEDVYGGVLYEQWLNTVLHIMEIPDADLGRENANYLAGWSYRESGYGRAGEWSQQLFDRVREPLPYLLRS